MSLAHLPPLTDCWVADQQREEEEGRAPGSHKAPHHCHRLVSPLPPEGVILSAASGPMFCDWTTQKAQFKDSFYFSLKKKRQGREYNQGIYGQQIVLRLS